MSGKEASAKRQVAASRSDSIWAALVLGLPLACGVILFLHQPQFDDTIVHRYLSHPVEYIEVTVFCCAIASFVVKLWGAMRQKRALRCEVLPEWDGEPQKASSAPGLLAHLARLPRSVQRSWVGQRCRIVLDYLCRRGCAAGLDDHIRFTSDNDNMALENSYSFINFLIWATPILGFLGTVLGIAAAISGVTPDQLEQGLGAITGGLATAFDTTGLALLLTMIMMLLKFIVERQEQGAMQRVDEFVDLNLFHRFSRPENEASPMLDAMESLVQRQAEVWAGTMEEMQERVRGEEKKQMERLGSALQQALEKSLASHQEMLAGMRKTAQEQTAKLLEPLSTLAGSLRQQTIALKPVAQGMAELTQSLGKLREDEGQIIRLQKLLQQNLAALASAGSFEEAVHSLTAAVHMLAARSGMKTTLRAVVGEDRSAA
jgi:hypothetical protein